MGHPRRMKAGHLALYKELVECRCLRLNLLGESGNTAGRRHTCNIPGANVTRTTGSELSFGKTRMGVFV
jgi:hypothetical protein